VNSSCARAVVETSSGHERRKKSADDGGFRIAEKEGLTRANARSVFDPPDRRHAVEMRHSNAKRHPGLPKGRPRLKILILTRGFLTLHERLLRRKGRSRTRLKFDPKNHTALRSSARTGYLVPPDSRSPPQTTHPRSGARASVLFLRTSSPQNSWARRRRPDRDRFSPTERFSKTPVSRVVATIPYLILVPPTKCGAAENFRTIRCF